MIPTTPEPGDIPTGPERPGPVRGPPIDEIEALKRTVQELRAQVKDLESRVARLEQGVRIG